MSIKNKGDDFIKSINRYMALFCFYGAIYFIIESIYKHHITNYRMAILGGILGIFIGVINNAFSFETDLILQGMIGSLLITLSEAIFGYQWNIVENLKIWDYFSLIFSGVGGQVCLVFTLFVWFPMSIVCILLDDYINYYILKIEPCPYYIIFGHKFLQFKERKN